MTVPSIEREQLRDLVRCREDIRADLMRARHRLGKFLLRREIYYERPGEPWALQAPDLAGQSAVRRSSLAVDDGRLPARPRRADGPTRPGRGRAREARRRVELRQANREVALPTRDRHPLRAGDLRRDRQCERFDHPDSLASYLGIVPSESTSGERRRQGAITKAGSTHARRLLIEAAYHYRRKAPTVEQDSSAAKRPARAHRQHRLARPTAPERPMASTSPRPTQAQRGRRGRDRARTGRLLLGDRPGRLSTTHTTAGGAAWASRHSRATVRASGYEQPPRRPRSVLDGGRATKRGLGVPSPRI